ncbi:hypothetical protein [Paraburkholderia sp. SIMBA_054]|uniref:hypothetical protein n=1 Tax=Paraburkholderia sp. SIMBA_054 TaxID=3085795 RepID=UPI00397E480C
MNEQQNATFTIETNAVRAAAISKLRKQIRGLVTRVREGEIAPGSTTSPQWITPNLFMTGALVMKLFAVQHAGSRESEPMLLSRSTGTPEAQIAAFTQAVYGQLFGASA